MEGAAQVLLQEPMSHGFCGDMQSVRSAWTFSDSLALSFIACSCQLISRSASRLPSGVFKPGIGERLRLHHGKNNAEQRQDPCMIPLRNPVSSNDALTP